MTVHFSTTSWMRSDESLQDGTILLAQRVAELVDSAQAEAAGQMGEHLSLLPWTEQRRVILDRRTRVVGYFSLQDYPWLDELYQVIGELPPGGRIVIRKAAQMGLTEVAINYTFWAIDVHGARVFYALPPGQGIVSDFAHDRIDSAISLSPYIQEMSGLTDNVGLKTFRRGALYLRGTHIPQGRPDKAAQLSAVPADVAVMDEWDRIPPAAIPLIRDRLGDSHLKIEIGLSTPTYPGYGIDVEYNRSDQREPEIRCQECGVWHWLEWALAENRDGQIAVWCPSCGAAIDRLSAWEHKRIRYRPRNEGSDLIGYWFPKLVSHRVSLAAIWERSQSTDPDEVQAFWNNDLGLPYEPTGSRLTIDLIRSCYEPGYQMPDMSPWSAMGVDVGLALHVWIVEPLPGDLYRVVFLDEVPSWSDLDPLMVRYGVGCCVADDAPELTADVAFARRHSGKAFLATYVEDIAGAQWTDFDLKRQKVRVDRTAGLDRSHSNIEGQRAILSPGVEAIPGFVEQMKATLKAKSKKADGTVFYHFPRPGRADHYDHAHVYALAALDRLRKLRPPEREKKAKGPATSARRRYRGRL